MTRLYNITKAEVSAAWKAVQQAGGGSGFDDKKIADIESDLDNELYKIWNRMSSGSYIAQPVLTVKIPKAKGGHRQLGIPTVSDRIAQMVIKKRLEPVLDPKFHDDSYAYRPGRSAIDAVTTCRERCFNREWVLELDIKTFFDDMGHAQLLEMVRQYTDDKCILLYVGKFLKAAHRTECGEESTPDKGTPQGGVVSPLLSNLYLHEVLDDWLSKKYPEVKFERYADDCVLHCASEKQAYFIKNRIEGRLKQYGLTMHPDKTRVVYVGTRNDYDHRGHTCLRKFTFLGYDFKPREVRGRTVFTPAIGKGALKMIRSKIKEKWRMKSRISDSLEDIAREVNPAIRGWITYYGHHRRSELHKLSYVINEYLVEFIKKKHKTQTTWNKAWQELNRRQAKKRTLFCHWMISQSRRGAV